MSPCVRVAGGEALARPGLAPEDVRVRNASLYIKKKLLTLWLLFLVHLLVLPAKQPAGGSILEDSAPPD